MQRSALPQRRAISITGNYKSGESDRAGVTAMNLHRFLPHFLSERLFVKCRQAEEALCVLANHFSSTRFLPNR
jgi:hypothetical protein